MVERTVVMGAVVAAVAIMAVGCGDSKDSDENAGGGEAGSGGNGATGGSSGSGGSGAMQSVDDKAVLDCADRTAVVTDYLAHDLATDSENYYWLGTNRSEERRVGKE